MSTKSILDLAAEFRDRISLAHQERGQALEFGTGNYRKKIHSDAAGVHPDQIPEAIEAARQRGVTIDFDAKGRPIFEDRSQRKKYLKLRGMNDMDGGYGDQTNSPCPFNYAR